MEYMKLGIEEARKTLQKAGLNEIDLFIQV